ncbi:hypothetical protein L914_10302 [Phytophthora nicotianae]|uniref:RxLR effector protein n=1 Tax=Phytophthora nicotianae TaxID=4792 RepID=W2N7A6_PHYNI|nr:hypothetical protein L914_10302 [Phytophthora nicotianae]
MTRHFLLIVGIILASFQGAVMGVMMSSNPTSEGKRSSKRVLRTRISEERNFNAPALEKLLDIAKANERIRQWKASGLTTDDVFNFVKVNEASVKLLHDHDFKLWTKFVANGNPHNPEAEIVAFLTQRFDEAKVATMLEKATRKWDADKSVTDLQNALFSKWYNERKLPTKIIDNVFKLSKTEWLGTPAQKVFVSYVAYLKKFHRGLPDFKRAR